MTETGRTWTTPYTATPGSSTPSPDVTPEEGRSELYAFAWLAGLNTAIIAVVGVTTFLLFR